MSPGTVRAAPATSAIFTTPSLRLATDRALLAQEHKWTAADLLRHLRYEGGRLVSETDYVRGRVMKTDVTVFPDGRFTLTTTNRGEAASRWVAQLQGRKVLRPVPPAGEPEAGE